MEEGLAWGPLVVLGRGKCEPGLIFHPELQHGVVGVAWKLDKKPLCGNQQGKISEQKSMQNTGSRKRVVFSAHSSSACLLQQRAG
jgi:hypothetical protein